MRAVELNVTVCVAVTGRATQFACDVLAYMARECDAACLKSVSARFGRHPNTVGRALMDACGMTFGEVLRDMRLQRASALLEAGAGLAQAARACGYSKPERLREALACGGAASPVASLPTCRRLRLEVPVRLVLPDGQGQGDGGDVALAC